MHKRRRRKHERDEALHVREWWREEEGSDALLALRAKLRLWIERAREGER